MPDKLVTLSNLSRFLGKCDDRYVILNAGKLPIYAAEPTTTLATLYGAFTAAGTTSGETNPFVLKYSTAYYLCTINKDSGTYQFQFIDLTSRNIWSWTQTGSSGAPGTDNLGYIFGNAATYQHQIAYSSEIPSIADVYKIQGGRTVATLNSITKSQDVNGNVYNITSTGSAQTLNNVSASSPVGATTTVAEGDNVVFVWNGGTWYWDKLAATVDTSGFASKSGNNDFTGTNKFSTLLPYSDGVSELGSSSHYFAMVYAQRWSDGTNYAALPAGIIGGRVAAATDLAPNFSSTSTYAVGDMVTYLGRLYVCSTAITTAAAWDSSKWTATNLASGIATNDDVDALFS